MEEVTCVGAMDQYYNVLSDSNYGAPVTFLAPGDNILAATVPLYLVSNDKAREAIKRDAGTSVAAPHVAGVAAIFRSWESGRYTTSDDLITLMKENAIKDGCGNVRGGTANLLLNTGLNWVRLLEGQLFRGSGTKPVTEIPPTADTANLEGGIEEEGQEGAQSLKE